MEVPELAFWLSELACPFVNIDGMVFLDRSSEGEEALRAKTATFNSTVEAQKWMNMLPLGDFIKEASDSDWNLFETDAHVIASVYQKVFEERLAYKFPGEKFIVAIWQETDPADIGISVIQSCD